MQRNSQPTRVGLGQPGSKAPGKRYTEAFRSTPGIVRNFEAQIIIKDGMQPVFAKA